MLQEVIEVSGCYNCKTDAYVHISAKSYCVAGMVQVIFQGVILSSVVIDIKTEVTEFKIYFKTG